MIRYTDKGAEVSTCTLSGRYVRVLLPPGMIDAVNRARDEYLRETKHRGYPA